MENIKTKIEFGKKDEDEEFLKGLDDVKQIDIHQIRKCHLKCT